MNKMGLCQRLWCLLVTVVLLLAAGGYYPDWGRNPVHARQLEESSSVSLTIAKSQAVPAGAGNFSDDSPYDGRTITSSAESLSSGASPLGGFIREKRQTGAGTGREQVQSASKAAKAVPQALESPQPAADSLPVAGPAPEQIISTMKVTATGYTAGYESTGKTAKHPQYGITYSGVKVRRDKNAISTIAADPRVLPLGSVLYIPGYGYAVVADTGSAIKGRKIDLYFATTKQVYKEWGKKTVTVQLIKRGNGKCTEPMLKSLGKAIQTYNTIPQYLLDELI